MIKERESETSMLSGVQQIRVMISILRHLEKEPYIKVEENSFLQIPCAKKKILYLM